jgi:hypothetical protein
VSKTFNEIFESSFTNPNDPCQCAPCKDLVAKVRQADLETAIAILREQQNAWGYGTIAAKALEQCISQLQREFSV